jgi:hypothetical protein
VEVGGLGYLEVVATSELIDDYLVDEKVAPTSANRMVARPSTARRATNRSSQNSAGQPTWTRPYCHRGLANYFEGLAYPCGTTLTAEAGILASSGLMIARSSGKRFRKKSRY